MRMKMKNDHSQWRNRGLSARTHPIIRNTFKITKLPKPEEVVALLQGLNSEGVLKEEEELGNHNNNAEPEDREEAWDEDNRKSGALSAHPPVQIRS